MFEPPPRCTQLLYFGIALCKCSCVSNPWQHGISLELARNTDGLTATGELQSHLLGGWSLTWTLGYPSTHCWSRHQVLNLPPWPWACGKSKSRNQGAECTRGTTWGGCYCTHRLDRSGQIACQSVASDFQKSRKSSRCIVLFPDQNTDLKGLTASKAAFMMRFSTCWDFWMAKWVPACCPLASKV